MIDFDDESPPVLHVEHRGSVMASKQKKEEAVHAYAEAFDRLVEEHALDAHQPRETITRRIGELGKESL